MKPTIPDRAIYHAPTSTPWVCSNPLSPDQLATSIGVATGHYIHFQLKLEYDKQSRKIDAVTGAIARRHYLREREVQDFASRFRTQSDAFDASASQALFLSYHPLMTKHLQPIGGLLVDRIVKQKDPSTATQEAYLCILSRFPSEEEQTQFAKFQSTSKPSRPELCRELVWALLCSSEFRFNH